MPNAGASILKQPKAVWAVAFACVISFMGIGLVDPILPSLASSLQATPTQVELLFTSYMVMTAVAMLITGFVSSRIGAKRTLVVGLVLIVVFAAAAALSDSIGGIIGFRAGWGVGNALFIATSLAVIVGAASGGFAGAIVLYEAALGLGIATGPLVGGLLGSIGWQGPFFGVAGLMAIALVATIALVPKTPVPPRKVSILAPLRALRHRTLLTLSLMALAYNWGFFTLLGYAPFPMGLNALGLGFVFFGWGVLVAAFSVFGAPWLQRRFGTVRSLYGAFTLMAVDLVVIALNVERPPVLIVAVIASGIFVGINNTLVTQAVMVASPVERPVASASYGFVRFIGGGVAPFVAGLLAEVAGVPLPFFIGSAAIVIAIVILASGAKRVTAAEKAIGDAQAEPADALASTGPIESVAPVVAAIGPRSNVSAVLSAAVDAATERRAPVHVLRVRESEIVGDADIDLESLESADQDVHEYVRYLRERGVQARGHVIDHVGGHRQIGRIVAERAAEARAQLVVVGPATRPGNAETQGTSLGDLLASAESDVLIAGDDRYELVASRRPATPQRRDVASR